MTARHEGGRIDARVLAKTVEQFRDSETATTLVESLEQVVDAIVAVFGVDGAGLMFIDNRLVLRYVAASDASSAQLERAQEELGHGPCVDSLVTGEVVSTADLSADPRWPGLALRVVDKGVVAVLGVPVRVGGQPIGSLNVYYGAAHQWDASEIDAMNAFTTVVESALGTALLVRQREHLVDSLQSTLDHRVTVERAVGLIMGREQVGEVEAFKRLRTMAQTDGRELHDVAALLVDPVVS